MRKLRVHVLAEIILGTSLMVLGIVFGLTGCGEEHVGSQKEISYTDYVGTWRGSNFSIVDADHGGHKYIVFTGTNSIFAMHSPSCPCQSPKTPERVP